MVDWQHSPDTLKGEIMSDTRLFRKDDLLEWLFYPLIELLGRTPTTAAKRGASRLSKRLPIKGCWEALQRRQRCGSVLVATRCAEPPSPMVRDTRAPFPSTKSARPLLPPVRSSTSTRMWAALLLRSLERQTVGSFEKGPAATTSRSNRAKLLRRSDPHAADPFLPRSEGISNTPPTDPRI